MSSQANTLIEEAHLKFRQAVSMGREVLTVVPDHFDALKTVGLARFYMKEYISALHELKKAAKLLPTRGVLLHIARCFVRRKKWKQAMPWVEQLIGLYPWDKAGLLIQYKAGLKLHQYMVALRAINTLLYINPNKYSYKQKRNALLGSHMNIADLAVAVYPECPSCGSEKGYARVGWLFKKAVCNRCGKTLNSSAGNLRTLLKLVPPYERVGETLVQRRTFPRVTTRQRMLKTRAKRKGRVKVERRSLPKRAVRVVCQLCDGVSYNETVFFECPECGRHTCVTCQAQFVDYKCQNCTTKLVKVRLVKAS
jgi:tetratricopeptide (TPR) repeat protein